MLTLMSRWFEPVEESRGYSRVQYGFLWLILATGAVLRFWGLDNVGLHGDEDIMALAARGVLQHGIPILPSEAVYARAPLHTYMIAASMGALGDSEWAIRFPSAVVGSLCGLLAFFMGKRFLDPKFNLAFAALITFLPSMIEVSQTGRMYVFFVACLLVYCSLLFRWEISSRDRDLVVAFLAWLFALQFHSLAIFAAPLFLFPGLSRNSWTQLFKGGAALAIGFLIFRKVDDWVSLRYPEEAEKLPSPTAVAPQPLELLALGPWQIAAVLVAIAFGLIAVYWYRRGDRGLQDAPALILLALSISACAALHYHIGGILFLLGSVFWLRTKPGTYCYLLLLGMVLALLALAQAAVLYGSGELQGRQVIGAMIGMPSVWPIIRFTEFSRVGSAAYMVILAFVFWKISQGRRVPAHYLFFLIAVWAPLLGIGLFKWNVPLRYLIGIMPFFMLCLLAGVSHLLTASTLRQQLVHKPSAHAATTILLVSAFANPLAVSKAASNDYRSFPDHKGAAEFIRSLALGPDDLIIAEDSINQTYYLGKVDFRLLSIDRAKRHSFVTDGVLRGQYTGTPIIGTGAELEAILDRPDIDGQIYIIGSGEGSRGYPGSVMRGSGIEDVLNSSQVEVIFVGRDGKTRIWRRR